MTPESIVVSLEWAKKLKEAGWSQDIGEDGEPDHQEYIDAPTAEEIMRRLPAYFEQEGMRFWLIMQKDDHDDSWTACYSCGTCMIMKGVGPMRIESVGMSNTAAKMYCYLAENNLLPPTV